MLKGFRKSIAALALCVLAQTAYCAPKWYFTLGAGLELPGIRSNTTVNNNSLASPPYNQDLYSTKHSVNAALLLELGKRWAIAATQLQALSLGLQYQYFLPNDVGRQIMQYSSPEFLNYRYKVVLIANILLLNAKFEFFTWKNLTPFLNIGAGAVQLTAGKYSEYAYSGVTARTSPGFRDNTSYHLIYQAGAGLNWMLTQTLTASINYLYRPLGRFTTNNGESTWSDRKLDFDNASAQSAFVTLTYLI
jgi:opacity protein-like surface antigen